MANALSQVLAEHSTAYDSILAAAREGRPAPTPSATQKRFKEAADQIVTKAMSPRGKVAFQWTGTTTVKVRIDQSTVIAHDALVYEANAAVRTLQRNRNRQVLLLHHRLYAPAGKV